MQVFSYVLVLMQNQSCCLHNTLLGDKVGNHPAFRIVTTVPSWSNIDNIQQYVFSQAGIDSVFNER